MYSQLYLDIQKSLIDEGKKVPLAENHFVAPLRSREIAYVGAGFTPAVVIAGRIRAGADDCRDLGKYLSKGKEPAHLHDQEKEQPSERINEEMERWVQEIKPRRRGRDVYHVMVSSPKGTNKDDFEKAVKEFTQEEFGNHRWIIVFHEADPDTFHQASRNLHAHIAFEARGLDGYKYRAHPGWKQRLRERWAEKAREHNIWVEASRKRDRGNAERNVSKPVHHMRKRGQRTRVDERIKKKARQTAQDPDETDFETFMREVRDANVAKAFRDAKEASKKANDPDLSDAERKAQAQRADDLRAYTRYTPDPKSERQLEREAQERAQQRER